MHTSLDSLPTSSLDTLHDAELRRLEHDELRLEELASSDPILRTMLAATRACRDQVARGRRIH